jgi:hypothetical protein
MTMQELNELLRTMPAVQRLEVARQLGPETAEKVATVRRAKYGNARTVVDGVRFDSKKEAARYETLKRLKEAGEVLWFATQPQFVLEGGVVYRADFVVAWKDGRVSVEDVKGHRTREYLNKRKQVLARYGLEIEEL